MTNPKPAYDRPAFFYGWSFLIPCACWLIAGYLSRHPTLASHASSRPKRFLLPAPIFNTGEKSQHREALPSPGAKTEALPPDAKKPGSGPAGKRVGARPLRLATEALRFMGAFRAEALRAGTIGSRFFRPPSTSRNRPSGSSGRPVLNPFPAPGRPPHKARQSAHS